MAIGKPLGDGWVIVAETSVLGARVAMVQRDQAIRFVRISKPLSQPLARCVTLARSRLAQSQAKQGLGARKLSISAADALIS
jgi:hypothetical protein